MLGKMIEKKMLQMVVCSRTNEGVPAPTIFFLFCKADSQFWQVPLSDKHFDIVGENKKVALLFVWRGKGEDLHQISVL